MGAFIVDRGWKECDLVEMAISGKWEKGQSQILKPL